MLKLLITSLSTLMLTATMNFLPFTSNLSQKEPIDNKAKSIIIYDKIKKNEDLLTYKLTPQSNIKVTYSKKSNNTSPSRGSNTDNSKAFTKLISMEATAYTGGTLTATGIPPVRNANGISTIAVDPSVIPLGTKVYVEDYGYAIAADTGGAIKGNIIDLYLNSEEECINFGRQNVNVYIVK